MFCSKCGYLISENMKYCPKCGEKITNGSVLVIERKRQNMKISPKISVTIDNNKYVLGEGQKVEVPIDNGEHRIDFALNFAKKSIVITYPIQNYLKVSYDSNGIVIEDNNKLLNHFNSNESSIGAEKSNINNSIIETPVTNEKTENKNDGINQEVSTKVSKWKIIIDLVIIVLVIGVIAGGVNKFFEGRAKKEAITLIKQQVYNDYGEVPKISASIIYKGSKKEIIVVKFELEELGFDGSYAVASYKQSGTAVGTTNEMQFDYDYKANIEEVKAIMGVE